MPGPDPFARADWLIERVYAYVAYRLGEGPDAQDVTSEAFARAVRYRDSYDERRGRPLTWLIGIARHCADDFLACRADLAEDAADVPDVPAPGDLHEATVDRLTVAVAVARLTRRERELIGLRYGADLTARQIAELLGERRNTVEVALHRALARLHELLEANDQPS